MGTAISSDIASATASLALQQGQKQGDLYRGQDVAKARQAAQEFEAHFISQMMQPMFDTIKTNEMFGGGPGEDMWKSLMVDEYGKAAARAGGIGIADHVMAAMLQAQETAR